MRRRRKDAEAARLARAAAATSPSEPLRKRRARAAPLTAPRPTKTKPIGRYWWSAWTRNGAYLGARTTSRVTRAQALALILRNAAESRNHFRPKDVVRLERSRAD